MNSESHRTYHAARPRLHQALSQCVWITIIVYGPVLSYRAAAEGQTSLAVLILILVAGLTWITFRNCMLFFAMSFSTAEITSDTVVLQRKNGIVFEARMSEISVTLLGYFGETYEVGHYSPIAGRIRLQAGCKRIEMSAERWEPFWRDLLRFKPFHKQ